MVGHKMGIALSLTLQIMSCINMTCVDPAESKAIPHPCNLQRHDTIVKIDVSSKSFAQIPIMEWRSKSVSKGDKTAPNLLR